MSDDDLPVAVFAGSYADAMFLVTLIESAGIEASCDGLPLRGRTPFETKVYVRRADAEQAKVLVDDFLSERARQGPKAVRWSVEDIVRAMNEAQGNPVRVVGRFLLWVVPLAGAFIISLGHGRGDFSVPPTRNETIFASALVLFAVGVLVKRRIL